MKDKPTDELKELRQELSDYEIVEILLESNDLSSNYNLMVRKYYEKVFGFCCKLLSNEADASDLAQEVFIIACKKIRELRSPKKLCPWLMGISKNLSKKYYRYTYNNNEHVMDVSVIENIFDKEQVDKVETEAIRIPSEDDSSNYLTTLFKDMPDKTKESLTLHCFKGMSYEKISQLLDVPLSTIKGRIYNGKKWIINRSLKPKAPKDLRKKIAAMFTSKIDDYSEIREELYADELDNQLILSFLEPNRLRDLPINVYTYGQNNYKDLMIITNNEPNRCIVLLRSDNKTAISAFLSLLPHHETIYITVVSNKKSIWELIPEFYEVINEHQYYSYYLENNSNNFEYGTNVIKHTANIEFATSEVLNELCQQHTSLGNMVKMFETENLSYKNDLLLFICHDNKREDISSYALFNKISSKRYWDLGLYQMFISNRHHLKQCIACGIKYIFSLGSTVIVNGSYSKDVLLENIANELNFKILCSYKSGYIQLK